MIELRLETQKDYFETETVIREAFWILPAAATIT